MREKDCLEALTFVLNNKFSCVKKTNKPHTRPCTHNIVSTVHVRTDMPKIDLEVIAQSFRNSSYDRKRFAAITIRIANPKITALLFSSGAFQQFLRVLCSRWDSACISDFRLSRAGKLVVTGSVSQQMAICACRQVIHEMQAIHKLSRLYYDQHLIQNIVCNVRVPASCTLDVYQMYMEHNNLCTYQPKIFPGLIFRPQNSPIVLLVFKSSRIIVTGGRTYQDVINGFDEVRPILHKYFPHLDESQIDNV